MLRLGLTGPGARLHGRLTLTAEQRERFSAGAKALFEREREGHLFEIFSANLREFEGLLEKIAEGLAANRISERELGPAQREADRRVLNVLTAMRTCLDHWETRLKRTYGKDSPQVGRFKARCAQQYDRRFGYRFSYKLRNYAQHCGLPVGVIRLRSRSRVYLIDPSGGPSRRMVAPSKERNEVVFLFRRDELLEAFDGWGTVQGELAARRNDISVATQLRALAAALSRINSTVLAISATKARRHARFLRSLMDLVRDDDTRRVPIVYSMRRGRHDRTHIELMHFPIGQMRQLLPEDSYLRAL